MDATEDHGEAAQDGNQPASKRLPSRKRAAQVRSNLSNTGNCPGCNKASQEAEQPKGEESEAQDQGADVVGGGEVEPVTHWVHLLFF